MDDFLDQTVFQALQVAIRAKHQDGAFKLAKIGQSIHKSINQTVRNDEISWLDDQADCPAVHAYFSALDTLRVSLNQSLCLGLVDHEAHFAIYPPKHFYKRHVDQFAASKDRRISCVYYLNEHWEQAYGGELVLYDTSGEPLVSIMPKGNRLVCFNSDMVHEVLTSHQMRCSIAAWLKTRPMNLVQ